MSRRVIWSAAALEDFDHAIAFIAAQSPNAARRVAAAIGKAGHDLGAIPTGRAGRVGGTYEKLVQGTSYLMAYTLADDNGAVAILRIIHAARDWPAGSWPKD